MPKYWHNQGRQVKKIIEFLVLGLMLGLAAIAGVLASNAVVHLSRCEHYHLFP